MSRNLFTIIFSAFIGLLLLLPGARAETESVRVYASVSANNVAPGSEVEARISVASREPVNAFDITLEYSPELFELVRASTGRSIVSLWKSLPAENRGGVMRFIGGMIEPFSGEDGELITLVFRARRSGATVFALKKADFSLADGKGTLVRAGEARSKVVIAQDAELAFSELKPPMPQISEVTLTKDPATKNPIILIKTEDDGGVREMRARARSWFLWGDWQKAQLTVSVPRYAWAIQLKAFGWDGQEANTVIYRWRVAALKLLMILLALGLFVMLIISAKKWIFAKKLS